MNLTLQSKTIGGQISILDSSHIRYIRGALTIDKTKVSTGFNQTRNGLVRKILPAGVPLAKNAASGKYVPVRSTVVSSGGGAGVTTCILDEPKAFMAGDEILIGTDPVTIATIDYGTGAITWAGGIEVSNGDKVLGTGGEGTAFCLLSDEQDLTDLDQVTSGFDHARVIEARLPVKISTQVKADLKEIAFV